MLSEQELSHHVIGNIHSPIRKFNSTLTLLNQLLIRSGREDQAMMTTLAGLVVVLSILVKQISVLFVTIKSLFAL